MSPEARENAHASTHARVPAYASTKLIAYLGNKRALLPFLAGVFLELDEEAPILRFLDPFAGSGAVSRLGRSFGWSVMANDAEEYSRAVNEAWLGVSRDELPSLFAGEGGLPAFLESLNAFHPQRGNLSPPCPAPSYIALHYAPADSSRADWRRERLFYTHENAVFLDRLRSAIDYYRPAIAPDAQGPEPFYRAERAILLGLLVYEAATHANTSGVFKAYHKGFGGHGKDALGRILSPMSLEAPLLWPGAPAEVVKGDAAAFCAARSAELCYLDPPYNQHQYGSNYHLLNTIASWKRPEVRDERSEDGSLIFASGIPESWKESRSAFCSRASAPGAFRELASSIDARTIVLSYNTEGLVPPEELFDILSDRAEVSLRSLDYVKYRGGRQSASRRSRNSEILFIARRRSMAAPKAAAVSEADAGRAPALRGLSELKLDLRLSRALAGPFDPPAFRALSCGSDVLWFRFQGVEIELISYLGLLIDRGADAALSDLRIEGKEALAALLEPMILGDNAAACRAAASLLESGVEDRRLQDLALGYLRKLAYRGYEEAFRGLCKRLLLASESKAPALDRLRRGLKEIEILFEARMEGRSRYALGRKPRLV